MPLHINPTAVLFLVAVVFLTGLVGAAVLGGFQAFMEARQRRADLHAVPAACRHCQYCRWGNAVLHEESVKIEDHDRVTVRCYVCNSCGLPQWYLHRASVTHYAES